MTGREEIPFNRPYLTGRERIYIDEALDAAALAGNGSFSKRCEQLMSERFEIRNVLLTTSCTAALEAAALLLSMSPGDEVILPSYTFSSTANAFLLRGATLRFVDIRPDTLNMDEAQIESLVNPRTRAIVPVHYAGVGCEMDAIMAVAEKHDLTVIEDAAQGVNATYKGRYLGTIGHLGCYSFHATKNIVAGEGGALLTANEAFADLAELIQEKGTNRSAFIRGQVDKYTWVEIGSSYCPSELSAGILLAQLEAMDEITAMRRQIHQRYEQGLARHVKAGSIEVQQIPDHCGSNYHIFCILTDTERTRDALTDHLRQAGINAVLHYVPLHTSPMGRSLGYEQGMLPMTESCADRLIRLPLYPGLARAEVDRVVDEIDRFYSA